MNQIQPYTGDEPYLFISYAHADEKAVGEVLDALQRGGCRFWYDEGVEAGSEWPEYIAGRLAGADGMIAFLSNTYVRSSNCRKEMHFALTKGIRIISIFLEKTEMTPGMEMQIGNLFALMKYQMSEEVFYEKLQKALLPPDQTPQTLQQAPAMPADQNAEKADFSRKSRKKEKPADKEKNRKLLLRRILTGVLCLAAVAAIVCGILFIPSNISALGNQTVTKDQAVTIAHALLVEQVGEASAQNYYVDYANRHLRYRGNIFEADYVYAVEFEDYTGRECKYLVNASTGQAELLYYDRR